MRHARLQKLQRFQREWPFYVFLFYGNGFRFAQSMVFQPILSSGRSSLRFTLRFQQRHYDLKIYDAAARRRGSITKDIFIEDNSQE